MKSICVFGESTIWGAWDEEKGGWVTRLQISLGKKLSYKYQFFNLGISGDITKNLLKRFKNECEARAPEIIILSTGGNDATYDAEKKSLELR